ncbi:heterogeneous nuclear ribonucleoprotein A/B-like isoform X1 [Balamuthia mandrillaris]
MQKYLAVASCLLLCLLCPAELALGQACPCLNWQTVEELSDMTETMYAAAVHDFNKDGHLDLLTGKSSGLLGPFIWYGDGAGNFTKLDFVFNNPGSGLTKDFALGLLDHPSPDQDVDFVLGGGTRITTFVSDPDDIFVHVWPWDDSSPESTEYTNALVMGDFNGDDYPDVLDLQTEMDNFLSWGDQIVYMDYELKGAFQGESVWLGGSSVDGQAHDLNDDARLDLVLLGNAQYSRNDFNHMDTPTVAVVLNAPTGIVGASWVFINLAAGEYTRLEKGYINDDEYIDFYATCARCSDAILFGTSTPTDFDIVYLTATLTDDSQALALVDVDGDSDLDAFIFNDLDACKLLLNDGTGAFTGAPGVVNSVSAGNLNGVFGDFNEDGYPDFVSTTRSPAANLLFLSSCECIADGTDGAEDGVADGVEDGAEDGAEDGVADGVEDGVADGVEDGIEDGTEDGVEDGVDDGRADGEQPEYSDSISDASELDDGLEEDGTPSDGEDGDGGSAATLLPFLSLLN